MQTITKYLALIVLALAMQFSNAQEVKNEEQLERLETQKEVVKTEEKNLLKEEVEAINKRLDANEISQNEADSLKQQAAEKHALNIQNRLAIIENRIELLKRNDSVTHDTGANLEGYVIEIGTSEDSGLYDSKSIYIGPRKRKTPKKYDRRTTSDLVFAIGFNNAIIEGESLNDSPYKIGGSGFVELGWAWKTRVFKNTNAVRFKYGLSMQWNKLNIKDNQYFSEVNDVVSLQTFPVPVKKSKFRTTNLVVPVHFEFGPSKKIEKEDYFRYSTYRKFKIGVGAFGGVNINAIQKVKYKLDGDREKDKYKDYNVNNFVYGLSTYVSWGNVGIYAKYDLSPIFKDQAVDQNNISLGIRFDMD
ncbi:coiled-coil domain-containing protein [Corallibacter sp.]|uniref:coiled-coil domain-containing protein n=1 Tax=Corallibacter sp. TaxID=2038084 RepID=UPI003AB27B81